MWISGSMAGDPGLSTWDYPQSKQFSLKIIEGDYFQVWLLSVHKKDIIDSVLSHAL